MSLAKIKRVSVRMKNTKSHDPGTMFSETIGVHETPREALTSVEVGANLHEELDAADTGRVGRSPSHQLVHNLIEGRQVEVVDEAWIVHDIYHYTVQG